jgi:uncharacterized protein (UPF0248 family)
MATNGFASQLITVHLRLSDPGGEGETVRDIPLQDVDASEHGIGIGRTFYPWHRVVSYEWEVPEQRQDDEVRTRQLRVRIVVRDADGAPREHVVPADRFDVGPWSVSMMVPERVEPEAASAIYRRLTIPWARVIEYERLVDDASADIGLGRSKGSMPVRPDSPAR